MQNDIFSDTSSRDPKSAPLAYKMRPKEKDEYIGFEQLVKRYPFLKSDTPRSMIIWGPPGSGKTTLVDLLCNSDSVKLLRISAVLSGVPELKRNIELAQHETATSKRIPVIFIDEIHRFNKIQQDALLPHVESGHFVLIGATTENPKSSVNKALLSRIQLVELRTIEHESIVEILKSAMARVGECFEDNDLDLMAKYSNGDARKAIGNLETSINLRLSDDYTTDKLVELIKDNSRSYDRNQDRHYDVISAFIKSLRGSDPDAAVLWLSVMIDGGEDPVFIARRLAIFASEDVGNADINALSIANNALNIVSKIGMPEARITLAQATIYLASTVKSNACYAAINEALEYVKSRPTIEVPQHLRSHNKAYKYPHDYDEGWVSQNYTSEDIPKFYKPKQIGSEVKIAGRLNSLWGKD
jgi:putative ATPase